VAINRSDAIAPAESPGGLASLPREGYIPPDRAPAREPQRKTKTMSPNSIRQHAFRLMSAVALAVLLAGCTSASRESASSASAAPPVEAGDPWSAVQLERPAELAAQLKDSTGVKPLLLHVGFRVLYRGGAIPGTVYVGPGSRDEGIAALKTAVQGVPHDRAIVLYCGCCPWDHCPNMKPAFSTLSALGFTNVRALYIAKDLDGDWTNAGYPIEKPKD
jgi:thiosulfate/3-mercaptopyruvate sulfurtransferase